MSVGFAPVLISYLSDPAPAYVIPVTLGAGFAFNATVVDSAYNPIPLDSAEIQVCLEKFMPTSTAGTVSSNTASYVIPSALCDQVRMSATWQALVIPTGSSISIPIAVGRFQRWDG